jgi:hypothetical protein
MVHRWGLGTRVGGRAAVGAATALALVVLRTGAALADAPDPSAPTPDADVVAAAYAALDPGADLPLVDVSLDPTAGPAPPADPGPPPPAPRLPPPVVLDRGVVDLTTCGLAVIACPPSGPARLVWDLLPLVMGAPGEVPAPAVPPMATADSVVPAAGQPAPAAGQLSGGDGAAPALDAIGLEPGTVVRPEAAVPAAPAGNPVPPPGTARPGTQPPLASTGMPVVAALAGLVLLVVGGCLTWARSSGLNVRPDRAS